MTVVIAIVSWGVQEGIRGRPRKGLQRVDAGTGQTT